MFLCQSLLLRCPSSFRSHQYNNRVLTVLRQGYGGERRAAGSFHEYRLQRRCGILSTDLCEVNRVCDGGNGPSFGLLRCVTSNALPSGSLMFESFRVELDDAVNAVKGDDGIDPQLGRFLNDPIHFVALDQDLSQDDGRGFASWGLLLVDDPAVDGLRGDLGHFHSIAGAASVVQDEGGSRMQTETIA